MNNINLNALRDRAYKTACEHGFHDEELSDEHFLCLIISELMEAVEADRKGRHAKVDWYKRRVKNSRICNGLDPNISKEIGLKVVYEETIKGTIDEELADTAIRLLDFAGLRRIDFNKERCFDSFDFCKGKFKGRTFTESVFEISRFVVYRKAAYSLVQVFALAENIGIDLMWHIEQKMKYNELRPRMHGKAY